jgi:hypothetical protein
MTIQGREIDLKQQTFEGFKMRLRSPVLLPGDVGYEESRTVWNAMIDRYPAAVVRCLGSADVIACVQFARENDLLLCIKGGGHNIAGLATADRALMIDLSLMRGVWVDLCGRSRTRRLAACSGMWTGKRSCADSLRPSASSRSPASLGSPWAAVLAI